MASPGNGNAGGFIQILPPNVSNAGPSFLQGSQKVQQTLQEISSSTQQLVADLLLLSELSSFASAMENYQARMQTSMNCLQNALSETGQNLNTTAETFVTSDNTAANLFQPNQTSVPTGTVPGLNIPGQFNFTTTSPSNTSGIFPINTGNSSINSTSPLHLGLQNFVLGGP